MADQDLNIHIKGDLASITKSLSSLKVEFTDVSDQAQKAGREAAQGLLDIERAARAVTEQLRKTRLPKVTDDGAARAAEREAARATAKKQRQAEAAAAAQKREQAAIQQLVVSLQQQAAAYGLTGSKLLELNKQRDLARVKTETERRAVAAAYDSMIAKARAAEAAQAKSAASTANALRTIGRAVAGLATSFVALQAVRITVGFADQFLQLNGVLQLATKNTEEFKVAQRGVFDIAQKTRAPVKETADTYGVLERTTRTLGLSQADLLRTLETVNKAIGLTPVSAQAAQSALVQFGQALGGDFKAGAQELNSILEQTPGLAISIAQGLGVETSQLKKMGEEGKLSTELVVRGLLRISDEVDKKFTQVPRTVSGAIQQLKNDLLFTLGRTDLTPLLSSLDQLRTIITDPAVVQGLSAIAAGVVNIISSIASGAAEIANFTKFLAESAAAALHGPAADDLVRTSERIAELREQISFLKSTENPFAIFGKHTDEIREAEKELAQLEVQYANAQKAAEDAARAQVKRQRQAKVDSALAKEQAEENFRSAQAELARKAAEEEAAKAAEKRQKQIRDTIDSLEDEAVTYGLAEEEVVAYQLALLGATDAQIARGREAARVLSQLKRETDATKERQKAEEDLAKSLEDAQARIAEVSGDTLASKMLELKRQRDELLKQIATVRPGDKASIDLVNRLFDVESARTRAQSIEQEGQRLINALAAQENSISNQVSAGLISQAAGAQQLRAAREETLQQLIRQRDELVELYKVAPSPETLAAIQEFNNNIGEVAQRNLTGMGRAISDLRASFQQLQENFAGDAVKALTDGLSDFFVSILDGSKSAGDALKDFVRGFAQSMLQIAARALATFAVLQVLDAIYPGLGKATAASLGASAGHTLHSGGIVGRDGRPRSINPLWFTAAPRYHYGGVAGLAPNEVPAILEKGEEVLPKNDPRNVRNGGGQQQMPGTRIINVFDPDFVPDQMNGSGGERVIMNHIGKNPGRVRQLLGIS